MAKPKISVNKLGEYMIASPSRRKQIIEDQQEPKTFMVARYRDAREQIVTYLSEGMSDDTKVMLSIQELRNSNGGSEFVEQDRQLSADAITKFLEVSDNINIDNLIVEDQYSFSSNGSMGSKEAWGQVLSCAFPETKA
ncbi:MAG: hypothetical protein WAW41_08675 [Methylobacter sp.]